MKRRCCVDIHTGDFFSHPPIATGWRMYSSSPPSITTSFFLCPASFCHLDYAFPPTGVLYVDRDALAITLVFTVVAMRPCSLSKESGHIGLQFTLSVIGVCLHLDPYVDLLQINHKKHTLIPNVKAGRNERVCTRGKLINRSARLIGPIYSIFT